MSNSIVMGLWYVRLETPTNIEAYGRTPSDSERLKSQIACALTLFVVA